jgi:hypothetical protein
MWRLLGGLLLAAVLIACTRLDCGWYTVANEDDELYLTYDCRF